MAYAGATAYQAVLTSNAVTPVHAAPGTGKSLAVYHISVSNKNTVEADVAVIAGSSSTERFNYDVAPDGGGAESDFSTPWILPEDTALNAQQDVNSATAYVTALIKIVPAPP